MIKLKSIMTESKQLTRKEVDALFDEMITKQWGHLKAHEVEGYFKDKADKYIQKLKKDLGKS